MRAFPLLLIALMVGSTAFAQEAAPVKPNSPEPPLPEKIRLSEDAADAPTVTIRTQDNGDIVEEYRQNGKLWMVKVRPPNGIAYTLMDTNGDGKLDSTDSDGPIGPVYYTIYRWD